MLLTDKCVEMLKQCLGNYHVLKNTLWQLSRFYKHLQHVLITRQDTPYELGILWFISSPELV